MGLYADSPEIDAITGDIKKKISIGVCGSFTGTNKSLLENLKEYLKKDGYRNIYTADDYPYDKIPITNGDTKYWFTYKKCMVMVNNCDIIIIFLLISNDDPEVNQSAIAEIQEVCSKRRRNVIILTQEGFDIRSMLKGIRQESIKWWTWRDFSIGKMTDCYQFVKQACHNLILENFVGRDS